MKYELIIVRYGEIALKGKETRKRFENTLVNNIKKALNIQNIPSKIKKEWGRIYIYTSKINKCVNVLKKVFGMNAFASNDIYEDDFDDSSKWDLSGDVTIDEGAGRLYLAYGPDKSGTAEYIGTINAPGTIYKIDVHCTGNNGGFIPDTSVFVSVNGGSNYEWIIQVTEDGSYDESATWNVPVSKQGSELDITIGMSANSAFTTFYMDWISVTYWYNTPPYTPSNPDPINGETGVAIGHDLFWDGGDPDGDTVYYDVYFGTSSNPPFVNTQTGTQYDPGDLNYGTTYYWKIVAEDEHGATTFGPVWHFTTETSQYNPPSVTTNEASVGNLLATLFGTLDSLGGANSCEVWFVYDDESHNNWEDYDFETDHQIMTSTGSFEYTLMMGTETYYFRAVASNSEGTAQGVEKSFQPPTLSLDPNPLDFGEMLEGETATKIFEIWNSGDGTLSYSFSWTNEWITDVIPTSGSSTGEHDEITVTIDTTGLSIGEKTGYIQIDTLIYIVPYDYPVEVKIVNSYSPPDVTLTTSDIDFSRLDKLPIINDLLLDRWPTIPDDMGSASYGYYGYESNTGTGYERAAIKTKYNLIFLVPLWLACEAHLRATYTVPVITAPGTPHHADISLAGNWELSL